MRNSVQIDCNSEGTRTLDERRARPPISPVEPTFALLSPRKGAVLRRLDQQKAIARCHRQRAMASQQARALADEGEVVIAARGIGNRGAAVGRDIQVGQVPD
jgi:hypothetical protein